MTDIHSASVRAVVARSDALHKAKAQFLQFSPDGAARWIDDPGDATAFESMREATRAAIRLPAALRAFSMPRPADSHARAGMH